MPKRFSHAPERHRAGSLTALIVMIGTLATVPASAGGGLTGGATEWTQILNNGELVHLVGQSTTQINNQITQISQRWRPSSYAARP